MESDFICNRIALAFNNDCSIILLNDAWYSSLTSQEVSPAFLSFFYKFFFIHTPEIIIHLLPLNLLYNVFTLLLGFCSGIFYFSVLYLFRWFWLLLKPLYLLEISLDVSLLNLVGIFKKIFNYNILYKSLLFLYSVLLIVQFIWQK